MPRRRSRRCGSLVSGRRPSCHRM
uniref:Uncharacterized protein n=1 Tax=Arundo donax TaxID=35708 RepID=A0A0A9GIR8_ARUDO